MIDREGWEEGWLYQAIVEVFMKGMMEGGLFSVNKQGLHVSLVCLWSVASAGLATLSSLLPAVFGLCPMLVSLQL